MKPVRVLFDILFWTYEVALAACIVFIGCGAISVSLENKYYASLSDDDKLEYVLDTYYDDINAYLGIPEKCRLDRSCISVADELVHEHAMGMYQPEKERIVIRSAEAYEDVGQCVQILAHELTHHRQYLADHDMTEAFLEFHAGMPGYGEISYEQESEYMSHMYVADEGFTYYNGRGCTYLQWLKQYIFGASKRGMRLITQYVTGGSYAF